MKAVFIDTNVIIDLLLDRKPFSDDSAMIFTLSKNKKIELFISAISVNNVHYILKKDFGDMETRKILIGLLKYLNVIAVEEEILKKALVSTIKDFEDAIQIYSADKVSSIIYIISRNTKDFKNSIKKVVTPNDFLKTEGFLD
jgi:predicted nucleic acid-binding protein